MIVKNNDIMMAFGCGGWIDMRNGAVYALKGHFSPSSASFEFVVPDEVKSMTPEARDALVKVPVLSSILSYVDFISSGAVTQEQLDKYGVKSDMLFRDYDVWLYPDGAENLSKRVSDEENAFMRSCSRMVHGEDIEFFYDCYTMRRERALKRRWLDEHGIALENAEAE